MTQQPPKAIYYVTVSLPLTVSRLHGSVVQAVMGRVAMQTTLAAWRKGCSAEAQVMELKAALAAA